MGVTDIKPKNRESTLSKHGLSSRYPVYRGSRNLQSMDHFLKRQFDHMESKKIVMDRVRQGHMVEDYEVPFAERFGKYKLRDFQDNTRMNIKNR